MNEAYVNSVQNYTQGTPGLGTYSIPNYAQTITTTPPVPASVGDEMKQIEQALSVRHQATEVLQNKMEPILSPEGPASDGNGTPERIGTSQIVLTLRSHRRSIEAVTARVQRLIQRVEL